MKFTINNKEFKNVMNLVKTVADSAASAKVAAHSICLLRAIPGERMLKLDFSINNAFLTYTFENVTMEGDIDAETEFRRSIDLNILSALRLSGPSVSISLGRNKDGNTLEFSSGGTKGKLLLSHQDIEKDVESSRPAADAVELNQQFAVADVLSALSAHNYGTHHNAQEAAKRPVRVYNKKGSEDGSVPDQLLFVSKDKIAAANFVKPMTTPFKDEFSYYMYPKPMQAVLKALSQNNSPVFHFGIARNLWRINHGQIDVWFPNIVPDVSYDLEELVSVVNTFPSFSLTISPDKLKEALEEVEPFTEAPLFTKEDMPVIRLAVENNVGLFTINTSKAKDVLIEMECMEFNTSDQVYDPTDILNINFKYLKECVAALIAVDDKKKDLPVVLKWWSYKDVTAPTKGKTLCIQRGGNYYWIARVRDHQRAV